MAKKELPEDEGPSQEWLASYADAMTLLLAFFIMMFAFALIDEGKYFDFKVGVMAALGVPDPLTDNTDSILAKGTGISPEVGLTPISPSEEAAATEAELRDALATAGLVTPENAQELADLLEQEFFYAGAAEFVEVGVDERGVFIRFDGRVLFPSGETTLDDDGLTLLATAADVLQIVENPLEVEGHTDSQPTNGGRWPSNWELSTARASRVVRWMIEPGGIPATRLTAVGLADTRPRANNNTAEGRQENRRVEIVTRVVQTGPVAGDTTSGDAAPLDADADADAGAEGLADDAGTPPGGDGSAGAGDDPSATPSPDPAADPGGDGDPAGDDQTGDGQPDGAGGAGTAEGAGIDDPAVPSAPEEIDPIGDPIGLAANDDADRAPGGG